MSLPIRFSAVLLAAGHSSRMGADKALLPCGSEPLWQRQWRVLEQAGAEEIFLSVRSEQGWVPPGLKDRVVRDSVPDAGPLAGIAAALARCSQTHLLVLAVDLPRMEPAWFVRLHAFCETDRGAVGRNAGFYEPLAAIYPRGMLAATETALASGEFSLQRLLGTAGDRMSVHEITSTEAAWFTNWNEPGIPPS